MTKRKRDQAKSAKLYVLPEIHALYRHRGEAKRDVIRPHESGGYRTASFVVLTASPTRGNPYAEAWEILNRAVNDQAYGLGLSIAVAHIVASVALDDAPFSPDVERWMRIYRDLALEIIDVRTGAATPTPAPSPQGGGEAPSRGHS